MRTFINAKRKAKEGRGNGKEVVRRQWSAKLLSFWALATSDRLVILFFVVWFLPLVITLVFLIFKWSLVPNEVPLFYSRVWGENQLAQKEIVFALLGGVLLWGIINQAAAIFFLSRDKVMTYLLCGTASLLSVLTAVTIFNVLSLFLP